MFNLIRTICKRLTETPHEAAQRRAAEWLPVLLLAEAKGVHVPTVQDADFDGKPPRLGGTAQNLGGEA